MAGIVTAMCAVVAVALSVQRMIGDRNARHDVEESSRVTESAALRRIAPWFDESLDRDSLPTMVKQIAATCTTFTERLDKHLVDEEDKVDKLTSAIEELREQFATGTVQRDEIMRQLAVGNPEIRRDPSP